MAPHNGNLSTDEMIAVFQGVQPIDRTQQVLQTLFQAVTSPTRGGGQQRPKVARKLTVHAPNVL